MKKKQASETQKPKNILSSFTDREREALEEYFRHKFNITYGRSTSSKTVVVLSDMHVGATTAICSNEGNYEPNVDQKKLLDFYLETTDRLDRAHVLLINGEPTNGANKKDNGYQNWTSDINEQIDDAERLIKKIKYNHLVMTRGSKYHVQDGWTSDEETLARKLNAYPYQGMFGEALKTKGDQKQMQVLFENGKYAGQRTDYYIFFTVHGKMFNATHHVGFNRWFAYRTTAIAREMADMEFLRGKYYGVEQDLDVIIRSHVHYHVSVGYTTTFGCTTPAYKFPDAHLFKGGLGGTYPSVGMLKFIVEPNDDILFRKYMMPIKQLPKPPVIHF